MYEVAMEVACLVASVFRVERCSRDAYIGLSLGTRGSSITQAPPTPSDGQLLR